MLAESAYATETSIDLNCHWVKGIHVGRFCTGNCCVVPKKNKSNCIYALLGFISSVAQFLLELKLAQLLV